MIHLQLMGLFIQSHFTRFAIKKSLFTTNNTQIKCTTSNANVT